MKSSTAPNVSVFRPEVEKSNRFFWSPVIDRNANTVKFTPKRHTVSESRVLLDASGRYLTRNESEVDRMAAETPGSKIIPIWTVTHDYFALPINADISLESVMSIAESEALPLTADEATDALRFTHAVASGEVGRTFPAVLSTPLIGGEFEWATITQGN